MQSNTNIVKFLGRAVRLHGKVRVTGIVFWAWAYE